ncbi:MAG: signal peptidase I [Odoribacter sp.]
MKIGKIVKNGLYYAVGMVGALFVALMLRLFVVDFFVVPSDSMLPAIEPGDFILVDKLSFGARMCCNFDFLEKKTEPVTWRIRGFSGIHHNDVVVFNFPYTKGWGKIRMNLSRFYVKRCIGLPGDTLSISDGFYEINGQRGFGNVQGQQVLAENKGDFSKSIYQTFPFNKRLNWNILNMGPLYIPRQGSKMIMNPVNVSIYKKLIEYESGKQVQVKRNQVFCGDSLLSSWCFRRNWYFMAGDHILNSQDSRYIGLIPEEFIVGKARLILTAKIPVTEEYRWKRFFTRIK